MTTSTSGTSGASRAAITVTPPVRRPYLIPRTRSAADPSWAHAVVTESIDMALTLGRPCYTPFLIGEDAPYSSARTPMRLADTMPSAYIQRNMSRQVSTIGRNATPVRSIVAESSPGFESKM